MVPEAFVSVKFNNLKDPSVQIKMKNKANISSLKEILHDWFNFSPEEQRLQKSQSVRLTIVHLNCKMLYYAACNAIYDPEFR